MCHTKRLHLIEKVLGKQPSAPDEHYPLRPGTVVVMERNYGIYLHDCGAFQKMLLFTPAGIEGVRGVYPEDTNIPEENEAFVALLGLPENELEKLTRMVITKVC